MHHPGPAPTSKSPSTECDDTKADLPGQPEPVAPPGSASDRARLLADVRDHIAERERAAAEPVAPPTNRRRWLIPLLLLLLAGTAGRSVWVLRRPVVLGSPVRLETSARAAIFVGVKAIELHRSQHGRLPVSLAEAGEEDLEIVYELQGESYTLVAVVGDVTVRYRSGEPLEPYASAFPALVNAR